MAAVCSIAPRMVAASAPALEASEREMRDLRRLTVEILRAAESGDGIRLAAQKSRRRSLLDTLAGGLAATG